MVNPIADIADVEELAVARIEALDGTPYDQRRKPGKNPWAWKEAKKALVVEGEAHPRGHLAFNVFAESGRNTGQSRGRGDDAVKLTSDLVVLFLYNIRASDQIGDQRAATRAARDVVAALLADDQYVVHFDVVNAWRPSVVAGGEWLLVRLDFTATFDLSLIPRSA